MISVTSPEQILRSPLNDSHAKYHWSFGKATRFAHKRPLCETFYEMPSTKAKRSTSFGSGKRTSFVLTIDSPSPMLYNLDKSVGKEKSRGASFGKGREECQQQGYIPTGAAKNPGPGTYGENKNKSVTYSMRPKTAYPSNYFLTDREKSLTPGPGTYEDPLQINSKGTMSSKVRNANRATLSFTSKRFQDNSKNIVNSGTKVPGPAHYDDHNYLNKDGKYLLSTNRSDGRRSFMNDKRELVLEGVRYTPGPGYYRMPSDFGHYETQPYQTLEPQRPMTARK